MAGILQGPVDDDVPMYEPEAPTYKESEYSDWTEETTYVISGPLGETKFPGTRYATWQDAQQHVKEWSQVKERKVYQFWTIPGRWFARVARS